MSSTPVGRWDTNTSVRAIETPLLVNELRQNSKDIFVFQAKTALPLGGSIDLANESHYRFSPQYSHKREVTGAQPWNGQNKKAAIPKMTAPLLSFDIAA
jgi:hypothetical protein